MASQPTPSLTDEPQKTSETATASWSPRSAPASSAVLPLDALLTIKREFEATAPTAADATANPSSSDALAAESARVRSSLRLLWTHRSSMTIQLLRDSGIGRTLTQLKKRVTGAEALLAAELLASWKATSGIVPTTPTAGIVRATSGTPATPGTGEAHGSSAASSPAVSSSAAASVPAPSAPSSAASSSAATTPAPAAMSPAPSPPPSVQRTSSAGGGPDILAESRKRKAEQLQQQTQGGTAAATVASPAAAAPTGQVGGERKRLSLMPPGSASAAAARAQVEIPYPAPSASAPVPVVAPVLPGESAFFTRPAAAAAAPRPNAPAAAAATAAGRKLVGGSATRTGGPDDLRSKVRLQLCRAFEDTTGSAAAASSSDAVEFPSDVVETSAEIEAVMFDLYRADTGAGYRTKSREIVMSLRDARNPELKRKVITGAISVHDLLTLPYTELASAALKSERAAALKW